MNAGRRGSLCAWALALCAGALLLPGGAGAATIVNGGFEAGNFSGWHVGRQTEAGDWYVYQGTTTALGSKRSPVTRVPKPPLGQFAAMADQSNPDSLILWQDIALEPGMPHSLSLIAYYRTYASLALPSPETLSVDLETLAGARNQQFRIDLVRPEAALDSVAPGDVLANLFATRPGGLEALDPIQLRADLTPFGGRTVRLRVAIAATGDPASVDPSKPVPVPGILNAGIDAVSVDGSNPNGGAGLRREGPLKLGFGRTAKNRRKGTVTLSVKLPAAGKVSAVSKKKKGRPVVAARASAARAKTVRLTIRPSRKGQMALREDGKLRVPLSLRFAASAGGTATATKIVVLELDPRR